MRHVVPPISRNVIVSPEDESSSDCSDLEAKSEDVRVDECIESKVLKVNDTSEPQKIQEVLQPMSRDLRERNISQEVKLS